MRSPIRFRPFLRPMVWGGRKLGELLHKPLPTSETFGESWEISDHGSHPSVVQNGSTPDATLQELLRQDARGLTGFPLSSFPWLVKYLDAADWLSVQVHPDEVAVRRLLPGEGSKTEAWFILDAQPGSRVYAGLKEGVNEEVLRRACADGTVADCLHSFEPRAGDCLFLPAGTVHAVGGGVLIAEVQQTSDATFRLFDWNRTDAQGRSRQLHLEEAIASIDWKAGPVTPVHVPDYPHGTPICQELVRCRYFHLDYVRQRDAFALGGGKMQVMMVLHGDGELWYDAGREPLAQGETILLPAAMSGVRVRPRGTLGLLLATLPESVSLSKVA